MHKDVTSGDDLTNVIGEIESGVPMTGTDIAQLEEFCTWCLQVHRVKLLELFLSRDRKRAVLIFRAPDAEAVRAVCRNSAMPMERIWACLPPERTNLNST